MYSLDWREGVIRKIQADFLEKSTPKSSTLMLDLSKLAVAGINKKAK